MASPTMNNNNNNNKNQEVVERERSRSPPSGRTSTSTCSNSSKQKCCICLSWIEQGAGQAIFTAGCSHTFHFPCIASNVSHGNQTCPVCRAQWSEVPANRLPSPPRVPPPINRPWHHHHRHQNYFTYRRPPPLYATPYGYDDQDFQQALLDEPHVFDDDESLDHHHQSPEENYSKNQPGETILKVKTFPEVAAVSRSSSPDNFTVLINLRAPSLTTSTDHQDSKESSPSSRVPIDLVTVVDVSGSMEGANLALLKQAMEFLIQNLGPNDRLSVIAFSHTARRVFPLRKMNESGREQALESVNLLVADGGTNIALGLSKGAKVLEDRRYKNSVASIILLSDGQDNYGFSTANYPSLLPQSITNNNGNDGSNNLKIPVHTFGFGENHDASLMHSIAEMSRGTFSFIQDRAVIQDAFAQCIGGLLSVVVKELQVNIQCVDPRVSITCLKSGSYPNQVTPDGRMGNIDVGYLYADEEKDFLVLVKVPTEEISGPAEETALLKVRCVYNEPAASTSSADKLVTVMSEEVKIRRPEVAGNQEVCVEVDRQQNRIQATEAMALAREAAERGDLSGAASILENCQKKLSESSSAKSHDILCQVLEAELKEMRKRVANRNSYEATGRAYMLSAMSSQSRQRPVASGLSFDAGAFSGSAAPCGSAAAYHAYQTPTITGMVARSRARNSSKGPY
ncbi:OLC1v1012003C1 [Oldenlandia corymbosa var. corymbosa]|uniref:OLC1v1012003C1 n=1 Tax=Oldenlandia corymbosa var. corymbosa TaxID=529605 RepID=A0AAV1DUY2_OLDCO|nr:OLC1v1012003C1 [Oldenlandia corymbosa var. corymbosa]